MLLGQQLEALRLLLQLVTYFSKFMEPHMPALMVGGGAVWLCA